MRLPLRQRPDVTLPGQIGVVRLGRRAGELTTVEPGDIVVLDHPDLDRAAAQRLVEAGVAAVLNVGPMISGRYPPLGPESLALAEVTLVDGVGPAATALRDGRRVRLLDGAVFAQPGPDISAEDAPEPLARGRVLELVTIREEMARAREGMLAQAETFTHNTTALLRREQDLLLHGLGLPTLGTRVAGRPVVVVAPGHEYLTELRGIRTFLRERRPVLVAVDEAAAAVRRLGLRPDVVLLSGTDALPDRDTLRSATDVVVRVDRGASDRGLESLRRLGIRVGVLETAATAEDAALLLADAGDAEVIVGVGMHATLEEFLDRRRDGLASTFLTRLKVGPALVDARAVPRLYSGVARPRHLLLTLLICLLAVAAAIATTPVGQEWAVTAGEVLRERSSEAGSWLEAQWREWF